MNNISQISKAKRLTEEEVHAAAEELQANGGKAGSIEVYRFLGRGSLTTITNFLKTWHQEEKATALPALTLLPEALKKSAEQLIVKVWAESQALAEQELKSQQEALRQAEALANEKIAEAEAFSEEQATQIEALETQIEELKKEKTKDHDYFLNEEKRLQKEIANGQKSEGILETRIINTEKQLNTANEKIKKLEAIITDNKKFEIKAGVQEEKIHDLNIRITTEEKTSELLRKDIEKLHEKAGRKENQVKSLENDIYQEKQRIECVYNDNNRLIKENRELIEKTAKLEGELAAWKEIKPESQKENKKPSKLDQNNQEKEFKQVKRPEENK